jgi:uncharacterized DUF497 family protein
MKFDWQVQKAEANYKKHGVRFPESLPVFEDDFAITITDDESDPDEQRFISIGIGVRGRLLVVIYTYREGSIRIISVRPAEPREIRQYEENR